MTFSIFTGRKRNGPKQWEGDISEIEEYRRRQYYRLLRGVEERGKVPSIIQEKISMYQQQQ